MIDAYYLSLKTETPNNDYWDYGFLNDFIDGTMWKPPAFKGFNKHEVSHIPPTDTAIVVIPARHHADKVDEINDEISKVSRCVLFLMGDEEADFPVEEIKHGNIEIWVQNPHPDRHDKYNKLGTGYPPQCRTILKDKDLPPKDTLVYFSGQITHNRRDDMIIGISDIKGNVKVNRTKGFTQGVSPADYYKDMSQAKYAPSPSGAVIPDSFRLFEALECMAIPIADEVNPSHTIESYWTWLLGESPFPKLKEWHDASVIVTDTDFHTVVVEQTQWWIRYKREFAYKIIKQLGE